MVSAPRRKNPIGHSCVYDGPIWHRQTEYDNFRRRFDYVPFVNVYSAALCQSVADLFVLCADGLGDLPKPIPECVQALSGKQPVSEFPKPL